MHKFILKKLKNKFIYYIYMSFINRLYKGIVSTATNIYNKSVEIFKRSLGLPPNLKDLIVPIDLLAPLEEEETPVYEEEYEHEETPVYEDDDEAYESRNEVAEFIRLVNKLKQGEKLDEINIPNVREEEKIKLLEYLIKNIPIDKYQILYSPDLDRYFTLTNKNRKTILEHLEVNQDHYEPFKGKSDYEFITTIFEKGISKLEFVINQDILTKTQAKLEKEKMEKIETEHEAYFKNKNRAQLILDKRLLLKKEKKEEKKKKPRRKAAFFNDFHIIDNPDVIEMLDMLQIFHINQPYMLIDLEQCLIWSLKDKISEQMLNQLKVSMTNQNYCRSMNVNKICKMIGLKLNVWWVSDKNRKKILGNKDDFKEETTICCLEDHYFPFIEDMKVTNFYIANYPKYKDPYTVNLSGNVNRGKTLNSYQLVSRLLEHKDKLLVKISPLIKLQYYKPLDFNWDHSKILNLDLDINTRPIIYKPKVKRTAYNIFFDIEAYPDEQLIHREYLLGADGDNYSKKMFEGENCVKQFLLDLSQTFEHKTILRLIAHNMTYDGSFFWKYFNAHCQLTEKDNRYVSIKSYYYYGNRQYLQLEFIDSYRIIPKALKEFPDMFGLTGYHKEAMFHSIINHETISKIEHIDKDYIINMVNNHFKDSMEPDIKETMKRFYENIKNWSNVYTKKRGKVGTVNMLEYVKKYCEQDVEILKNGFRKFTEIIKEQLDLDVDDFLSLPSIANNYLVKEGCFDGCYQLSGGVGSYWDKHINGGKVMLRNNRKQHIKDKIQDFDGVSLYPSAMHFFPGFVKGKPKLITNLSYDWISKQDYYFVTIKLKKIRKKRPFPLFCIKNSDGTNNWTNNAVGEILYVDKVALEDIMQYHNVKPKDIEIIEGYYFDERFNTKVKEVIKRLFDKRCEFKAANNLVLAEIYKLIMNSSYGKLLEKPPKHQTNVKKNKEWVNHFNNNYDWIESFNFTENKDYVFFKEKSEINKHFSSPHLGCQILSYSKRIMNKVLMLADDHNIPIFYMDTDSTHLLSKDVDRLNQLYIDKHKTPLIGKNLGQFHNDFSVKGFKDLESQEFIGLGKKMYIDKLLGTNEKTGELETLYHIRMKSIPTNSIRFKANEEGVSPLDIYKNLYDGDVIVFDLNVNNKVNFRKNKNQRFVMTEPIERWISI